MRSRSVSSSSLSVVRSRGQPVCPEAQPRCWPLLEASQTRMKVESGSQSSEAQCGYECGGKGGKSMYETGKANRPNPSTQSISPRSPDRPSTLLSCTVMRLSTLLLHPDQPSTTTGSARPPPQPIIGSRDGLRVPAIARRRFQASHFVFAETPSLIITISKLYQSPSSSSS
jgi:hypothetical protein